MAVAALARASRSALARLRNGRAQAVLRDSRDRQSVDVSGLDFVQYRSEGYGLLIEAAAEHRGGASPARSPVLVAEPDEEGAAGPAGESGDGGRAPAGDAFGLRGTAESLRLGSWGLRETAGSAREWGAGGADGAWAGSPRGPAAAGTPSVAVIGEEESPLTSRSARARDPFARMLQAAARSAGSNPPPRRDAERKGSIDLRRKELERTEACGAEGIRPQVSPRTARARGTTLARAPPPGSAAARDREIDTFNDSRRHRRYATCLPPWTLRTRPARLPRTRPTRLPRTRPGSHSRTRPGSHSWT